MEAVVINYWAVFLAAIAYMAVGMLWYGPVFGKQWQAFVGLTPESMKSMPLAPWQAMLGGFVTALVMAYVLAHVIKMSVATFGDLGLMTGLMTGFWSWLGFVLTTQAGSFLWEGKKFGLLVLNGAASLVSLLIMGALLALWV